MATYQARPTASQIAAGYFILPRALHKEWKDRFPFYSFDVSAFGKEYKKLRLDQNYRVRITLRDDIASGDVLNVVVVSDTRLAVSKA
jgi:hypothetical protein